MLKAPSSAPLPEKKKKSGFSNMVNLYNAWTYVVTSLTDCVLCVSTITYFYMIERFQIRDTKIT